MTTGPIPGGSDVRRAAGAAGLVMRASGQLGLELTRIALGSSTAEPAAGDRRFADPAWTANPVFRRIKQGYLASADALSTIADGLGSAGGDPRRAELAVFAANVLISAAAPTNFPLCNPAAIKRAFEHRRSQRGPGPAELRRGYPPQRRHAVDGAARRLPGRT